MGRDLAVGALIALPLAVLLVQIDQTAYRSGAATIAILVVLGLALRWTVAAGAAPVLLVGVIGQTTEEFRASPPGRDTVGIAVIAAAMVVVVLALRRWEGDRRRAVEEAGARMRNERRLQALVDLAHHLAGVADRSGLFAAVERPIPVAAGSDGAVLLLGADDDRLEFSVVAGHDVDDFPLAMPFQYVEQGTPAVDVLRSGAPVFCATAGELVTRYPALRGYVERSRQHAWAALPVPGLGVVSLSWHDEQVFSPAQRAFLVTIGNLYGAAAQRVRSVEESELERFVGAFDAMLDGVGILRAVRDASGAVVDLEIEYLNPSLVRLGGPGDDDVGRRLRVAWPESPLVAELVHVVDTERPFVLEEVDAAALGARAGTATVSIRATRLDLDRIVVVVRDVSERAELLKRIREANDLFEAAQELAHVGSWRYDIARDELEWSAELYRIVGVPEGAPPVRPTDGSLFGFEHADDRGLITTTVSKALADRAPFTFDMRIIRQSDGDVREVTTTGTVLTDADGNLAGVWGATQDVTERRRAERFRREALDALERQREAVAELQRVILPATLPAIAHAALSAHYRAATASRAIGGDWYDAFVTHDGRIVIAIGDVAGHGLECAALANHLRVSMRVRANDGMTPAAILAHLDDEVTDGFVTCWVATFDVASRRLQVANAGHLPAALSRCGRTTFVGEHTSPPLGTRLVTAGAEIEIALQPEDLVVLFTDGLVERRGEHLDRGLERLARAVPLAGSAPEPALDLVERLAPDAADDVCVVTLRILSP